MQIVNTSFNWRLQENAFYSNINRCRSRGGRTSSRGWHESSHGGHHQHEGKLHKGFWKNQFGYINGLYEF